MENLQDLKTRLKLKRGLKDGTITNPLAHVIKDFQEIADTIKLNKTLTRRERKLSKRG